ncbi:hypothetical protein GNI_027710, partial [Gregarina niphandrodes]
MSVSYAAVPKPSPWDLPSAEEMRAFLYRKVGRLRKKWCTNLFVIEDGVLFVCWDQTSHFLIELAIPLTNILQCVKHVKDNAIFSVVYTDVKNRKGKTKSFRMEVRCNNEDERDGWVDRLLSLRETSRALSGELVDRQKAEELLQKALGELRRAAALSLGASVGRLQKMHEERGRRRAFLALADGQNRLHGILKGSRSNSVMMSSTHGLPPTDEIVEREVQRRLSALKHKLERSQSRRDSMTGKEVHVNAVRHTEAALRLVYWFQ